ncbi:hypothetical protein RHS01_02684 [Rhizoctonia solani]|uniref:Uncharacterized protein n=1 Tax=Rhizoctonia solani TaxID=456999 RepID=A0A8H7IJH5_9AGAM|nr:hypothetical protein RHS01_02684 [Rhizoctonia solani]
MKWQPAPGAPLVPNPLSIKESRDPLFRQPPMSQGTSNQRSTGKYPSAVQSPSSWIAKPSHPAQAGTQGNQGSQQGSPRTGWEQSTKPSLASRLMGPNPTHQKTGNHRNQSHAQAPIQSDPLPAPSAPLIAWANPTKPPITFTQPTPVRAPPQVQTPAPPLPIRLRSPVVSPPAAPVAAYQAPSRWITPTPIRGKLGMSHNNGSQE